MPIFDFKCPSCDTIQERMMLLSNEDITCNSCNSKITSENKIPSAINYVTMVGGFNSKIPEGFKDKLREMKRHGGKGSKIDV